ncbi:hypothetical protein DSECCO2_623770 [anaerobic digester metagenome]
MPVSREPDTLAPTVLTWVCSFICCSTAFTDSTKVCTFEVTDSGSRLVVSVELPVLVRFMDTPGMTSETALLDRSMYPSVAPCTWLKCRPWRFSMLVPGALMMEIWLFEPGSPVRVNSRPSAVSAAEAVMPAAALIFAARSDQVSEAATVMEWMLPAYANLNVPPLADTTSVEAAPATVVLRMSAVWIGGMTGKPSTRSCALLAFCVSMN